MQMYLVFPVHAASRHHIIFTVSILTQSMLTVWISFIILIPYVSIVLWQPLIITVITILIITGVGGNVLEYIIVFPILCCICG